MSILYPNYQKSLLSVSTAILNHYGVGVDAYPPAAALMRALSDRPRTVLLILLDGLGTALMDALLPETAFLRTHRADTLTSVCPSATVAATTSLWTGLAPQTHGWLGWSMYFKECGHQIDTFLRRDSFTHQPYTLLSPAEKYLPYTSIFERLHGHVETHTLFPFPTYATRGADVVHTCDNVAEQFRCARQLCTPSTREKFVAMYITQPDAMAHKAGVTSKDTRAVVESLNQQIEQLHRLSKDTLVIVTADHGLIDLTEYIAVDQWPELSRCLIMPPSLESRAAVFYVKSERRMAFEAAFRARCGADFELWPREEALANGWFGGGRRHEKTEDFLGDYIAFATGHRAIAFDTPAHNESPLKAQHGGLTEDEMRIPLVLARTRPI